MAKKDRSAYILILPSMFTTGNLFCGFYAIIRAFNHDFEKAAYAILLAAVFDALDGRVARMVRCHSEFGVEYDSIADVVSFGLAPAILAYVWALESLGRVGWVGAFFFAACSALRLARFNAMAEEMPKSYFVGLPTPVAANLMGALVIACAELHLMIPNIAVLVVTFILGLLMVSNVRYRTFKDIDVRHRRSFFQLVLLVMILAFMAIKHEITLFVLFAFYTLWGVIRECLSLVKRVAFGGKAGLRIEREEE